MKKLLVILALFVIALPAMAQNGAYQEKGSDWWYAYNPCCEEMVYVEFDYHIVSNKNNWNVQLKGDGYGEWGTTYRMKEKVHETYQWSENGAYVAWYFAKVRYQADDGCGFVVSYKMHFVINANGDVVLERYEYTIECDNGMTME